MQHLDSFLRIIDLNLISCLVPMLLTIRLVDVFYKGRFQTNAALNTIRWIIIGYTALSVIRFVSIALLNPEVDLIPERATGPYMWAYWLMWFSSFVLPFALLSRKLANKFWVLILVAFLMKIGTFSERFVILVTSLHRDFIPLTDSQNVLHLTIRSILIMSVQGIFLSGLLLVWLEFRKKWLKHP